MLALFSIRPGIPTQVVMPSVSRANDEQGAAGTVLVETFATLSNPVSVRTIRGLPPGKTTPAGGAAIGGEPGSGAEAPSGGGGGAELAP
jgi:hypothetical protein